MDPAIGARYAAMLRAKAEEGAYDGFSDAEKFAEAVTADVQAVKIDRSAVFVQRSGKRAYDLSYTIDAQDYSSSEISRFHPTVLDAGVKLIAVQRQPDTRIWFVLNDGTCAMLTYE
ncbi:MAG: hypothetical protein AAFW68_10170, partial [Pseudomonadota bacterium]